MCNSTKEAVMKQVTLKEALLGGARILDSQPKLPLNPGAIDGDFRLLCAGAAVAVSAVQIAEGDVASDELVDRLIETQDNSLISAVFRQYNLGEPGPLLHHNDTLVRNYSAYNAAARATDYLRQLAQAA